MPFFLVTSKSRIIYETEKREEQSRRDLRDRLNVGQSMDRILLRSYHQRGWASAAEPSRPARSLPKGPSFSRASWSPANEVSWRSLRRSSAPSHMHEFASNECAVLPLFSLSLFLSPRLFCHVYNGVNLRRETNAIGARRLDVAYSTHPCDFV